MLPNVKQMDNIIQCPGQQVETDGTFNPNNLRKIQQGATGLSG